ncbi:MAG: hypothetical protein ACPGAP_12000, partial [Akkermansiaceae bacterium]
MNSEITGAAATRASAVKTKINQGQCTGGRLTLYQLWSSDVPPEPLCGFEFRPTSGFPGFRAKKSPDFSSVWKNR